tara:strand:- start:156 stop:572 length:417 start_codon:yes stop_codon:yes gene_type:complete
MFSFFQKSKINRVGFEDIKKIIQRDTHLLINTLQSQEQDILIKGTVNMNDEETVINEILGNYRIPDKPIVLYGRNCCDTTVETKFEQIQNLGMKDIYVYYGGLFEWLLLNELYGDDDFPLSKTTDTIDIHKYRPLPIL